MIFEEKHNKVSEKFSRFINDEVLPLSSLRPKKFWDDLEVLISELPPMNYIRKRSESQIDSPLEVKGADNEVIYNASSKLDALLLNTCWGSLYNALYETDVIPQTTGLKVSRKHNPARTKHVITYAKNFLDEVFPLYSGSHHDVASYQVYYQHLHVFFPDGSSSGLKNSIQFVAYSGSKSDPGAIVLKKNDLHIEIQIDRSSIVGASDLAGIDDIMIETSEATIMSFEVSSPDVSADDKINIYRHLLKSTFDVRDEEFSENTHKTNLYTNKDKVFTARGGKNYRLPGRKLRLTRSVGLLMGTELMQDNEGNNVPEGIVDAVVSALITSLDCSNSMVSNIYIVKPKMHKPEEFAFICLLFSRIEDMLNLEHNTIKLGITDDERRTTVNLKKYIRMAKQRIVFINTEYSNCTDDEKMEINSKAATLHTIDYFKVDMFTDQQDLA